MRRRRLGEELVSIMFAIAFDLEVFFGFFDPAIALELGLLRIVVRTLFASQFRLDRVFVEAVHLPSCDRVHVSHDACLAAVERVRLAGVVAFVNVVPCAIADGHARRTGSVAVARKAVVVYTSQKVAELVRIE
eukprot:4461720-Pleurochrysis_carterae.AAC.1